MRSPVVYYGGKAALANDIVKLFPEHVMYCEPFVGGGSLYFTKPPSEQEVINDVNEHVVNFYQMIKSEFGTLRRMIQQTPHSRSQHRKAAQVLKHSEAYTPLRRAWAFRVQCNMSFSGKIFGGYAYERGSKSLSNRIRNKRKLFNKHLLTRLELTDIECNDALQVIKYRDTPNTFFYIDPPYINSDQGHYKGYTLEQFQDLLTALQKIKGKFLMSSYPHELLDQFAQTNGWQQLKHTRKIAVHKGVDRDKTEVLTANYDIHSMRDESCDPKRQKKRTRKVQQAMPKAYPLSSFPKQHMHESLIGVSEFKSAPQKALKGLKNKPCILLMKNKPIAVLVSVEEYEKSIKQQQIKSSQTATKTPGKDTPATIQTNPQVLQEPPHEQLSIVPTPDTSSVSPQAAPREIPDYTGNDPQRPEEPVPEIQEQHYEEPEKVQWV